MKRGFILALGMVCLLSGCKKAENQEVEVEKQMEAEKEEPTKVEPTNSSAEPTPAQNEEKKESFFICASFDSEALKNNIVNEPTEKEFYILLPPTYYTSEKRYPVVYYLHGQADDPTRFPMNFRNRFTTAFENGANEFIVVAVNGDSNKGGAFYVNSPVSGNYEDYIVNEVVAYIDENYRTIANRDSRGICGFSMGGFGAYNLAFRHPDIYNSVLSVCPGALADGDLTVAMSSWRGDSGFLSGYARAFSPLLEDESKVYGNIPVMDDSKEDLEIQKDWESGFGNINEKLDAYLALNNPLTAIKIMYGTLDYYKWIPNGCEFLAQCMKDREIEYELETFDSGHNLPVSVVEDDLIPFFNEHLVYE